MCMHDLCNVNELQDKGDTYKFDMKFSVAALYTIACKMQQTL